MATTVSRRMVFIKAKKTNKPHVPLPKQRPPSDSEETVGDAAKPLVMSAPVRRAPPRTWWQQAAKPAGIFFGLLAGAGFLYVIFNASDRPSYDRSTETTSVQMQSPARVNRVSRAAAYPGAEAITLPVVLSNRSAPTPESFRQSGYVRQKVEMPNMSGDCVVKGGLDHVLGDCLRARQGQ